MAHGRVRLSADSKGPQMPPTEPTSSSPAKPNRRPDGAAMIPGSWIWPVIIGAVVLIGLFNLLGSGTNHIPYSVFKDQLLNEKNIAKVTIGTTKIYGEVKSLEKLLSKLPDELKKGRTNKEFATLLPRIEDRMLIEQLDEAKKQGHIDSYDFDREAFPWGIVISNLLVIALLILIIAFAVMTRFRDPLGGSFLNNYIKSPAKRYEKNKSRVTFEDVAGMETAKGELAEVVDFLRTPEKYQKLGGQIPKGVLLVGPPGTGKTLLARAVAGEAGVPFFSIGGSEFIQMFVGVGASRVRDLFKTARDNAPCILFIDEIDAVGRVRGAGLGGGHDEREQTLNQILSEMDGFLPTESVIVVAATNRPDVLDPALLRPGRFDRHVTVDRPTWQGRLAILKVHTRDKPLADDVNLETIARTMIGMTGADLRNLANESALIAAREGKSKIDRRHFAMAADRIRLGAKGEKVLTAEEKRRTAYHEAGHALTAYFQPSAMPVTRVSIIPRGQGAGVTQFQPNEDQVDHTREQLVAILVTSLGGRAADQLIFGEQTSGAAMDLKQATRVARMMVTQFGMSERLGPVSYRVGEEHVFLGKEIQEARDFSEGTAQLIDEEVRRILQEADQRALRLLQEHRRELDLVVDALLQHEELDKDQITLLLQAGRLDVLEAPSSAAADAAASNGAMDREPAGTMTTVS
jgi:cell division protease FtsH